MIRHFILALFLFFAFHNNAHTQGLSDSLNSRLQENIHDSDRVMILNKLAWRIMYTNVDTAILLTSEALVLAEAINLPKGISQSTSRLGTLHYLQGDFERALEYYFWSLKVDEEIGNRSGMSIVLGNIGLV